jgi:mRNA interferase HigB
LRVLGTDVLDKACRTHADLVSSIAVWLAVARGANWKSLHELRLTWRNTDCVKGQTIFNIKGNKYRLLATVNYASQTIIIKEIMSHAEYSRREWNK